ncbi:sulfotransferase family 2 domain-containing protein [Alteromonas macleodii]|uniref:sulfotransferase family 2 domain-containing protein n=1 Tax=Alteromonas macleodii TaxID=28108 RepID=UPI0020766CA9|nr:sulfotransferase family 2 domain-containing protein [Alteromonas macleodii]USI28222.1 sulfotransferase family 2 domain-containing protein [Alteromonas macleodii]
MRYEKAVWAIEKFVSPRITSINKPNKNIQLLSYHIPKTAGSSLRSSFEDNISSIRIFGAYLNSGATELSKGHSVWVPKKTLILHGHFKPHDNHSKMFPNALKITWVRDPIERVFSLVRHLMMVGEVHPHFQMIKKIYPDCSMNDIEKVVSDMVTNNTLPLFTNTYTHFFSNTSIESLDFVGSVHNYNDDLKRLSELSNYSLTPSLKNVRGKPVNEKFKRGLRTYLRHEYEIVERYL